MATIPRLGNSPNVNPKSLADEMTKQECARSSVAQGFGRMLFGARQVDSEGQQRETSVQSEFRVRQSARGYRVEVCLDGEPYVTLLDGLTREGADREANSLMASWSRISAPHPICDPVPKVEQAVRLDRPYTGRNTRVGDWT